MRGPKGNPKKRSNANHSAGNGRHVVLWELRELLLDEGEQVSKGIYWLTRSQWARVWYGPDLSEKKDATVESQWWSWRRWADERRLVAFKQPPGRGGTESGVGLALIEINRCINVTLGPPNIFHRFDYYPTDSD